jgi:hypothetical protein
VKPLASCEAKALGLTPEGATPGQHTLTEGFCSACPPASGCVCPAREKRSWSGGGRERVALRPGFGAEPQGRNQVDAGERVTPPAKSHFSSGLGQKPAEKLARRSNSTDRPPNATARRENVGHSQARETRLLACRLDALTVAHHVDVAPGVDVEFDKRQVMCALARVAELTLGPFTFSLARSRSIGRFHLENHDCRVLYDRQGPEGWNVEVVLRAIFLATHTLDQSLALSTEIARELGRLGASRLRRFDLAADYMDFPLERCDADNLATTRAKMKGFLTDIKGVSGGELGQDLLEHQDADRRVTGLTVAPGNAIMVRIYDKTKEVSLPGREEKRAIEEELWKRAGWTGEAGVTRVEVQVRSEALDDFQLRDPRDLQAKMDSIWQYCVSRWVRMVVSTSRRRSRCALDPRWGAVVATVFDHPSEPAVRRRTRGGATAQHALGTVISRLGATGSLPNVVQGDEREFVDAMTPNQREIWLKQTLDEIAGRQSTDAFKQLVLRHGAHDAAVWLAVKLGSGRARFWSVDDELWEGFSGLDEGDGGLHE